MRNPLRNQATRWAVVALLMALCAPGSALANRRPRRLHAALPIALTYHGPIPKLVMAEIVSPAVRPQLVIPPSYYEERAGRVQKDFLTFQPDVLGQNPAVQPKPPAADAPQQLNFVAPSTAEDPLQQLRELERLVLFRSVAPSAEASAILVGASMFMTAVVGAAHAPSELRFLFDGPVHLGPAIFQGGGMGAGVAAHF